MELANANILQQLQKDILSLQGFKHALHTTVPQPALGPIKKAFSNAVFPSGAVHEFICGNAEDAAATGGFIAGILSALIRGGGIVIWIGSLRTIFPPALKLFGIDPDKIIFIDLHKEKDILWSMEEALKCDGLAAVVGEIKDLSFITSRRLQLAVEKSQVTGFILRHNPHSLIANACIARWKISSLPCLEEDEMPGVGFPRWNVELLKIRNGKPGSWVVQWKNGSFRHTYPSVAIIAGLQKKTG